MDCREIAGIIGGQRGTKKRSWRLQNDNGKCKTSCMKPPYFVLAILCLIASSAAKAAPPGTDSIMNDPVMARGKGFEIRRSDMDHVLKSITVNNPGDRLPPDAEVYVINQLIEIQLVLQQATTAEKTAGEQAADLKLAETRKNLGEPEFERRLQDTGMTADDLRLMLAQEDTAQTSLARQLGINVTDADAKKLFDSFPPGSYDRPATARVRELLLLTTSDFSTSSAPPLPAATIQAKHTDIFNLLKRIRNGEDFAALAKQYNEDPLSKGNGDILSFTRDKMEFGDLAFSMKPNQISGVLTNEDGYRIFQLLEIIPAKKVSFADLDDKIKKALIGEQKRRLAPAYLEKLRKEAGVEILDARLKTMIAPAEPGQQPQSGGQR
jgi:parvulin-like peptidyl-prolyl isomerase